MPLQQIEVNGVAISVKQIEESDYISLSDIVKHFGSPETTINRWLTNKATIEFLGVWEKVNNPVFKLPEFEQFKNEAGSNAFHISVENIR